MPGRRPLVIAHRGASAVCRENTIEAFAAARRLGADMVELDVRRSADGVLVVHHDPVVEHVGPVVSAPARSLPQWMPTLEEAFAGCEGMGVNVEVKNLPGEPDFDEGQTVAEEVAALVARGGWHDRVLVSSFNLFAVDRVRQRDAAIATAWLTLAAWDQAAAVATAAERGHQALHPQDPATNPELVRLAHDQGLAVNAWTVDDPERIRELARMGVDGIVTNVVDVALGALGLSPS